MERIFKDVAGTSGPETPDIDDFFQALESEPDSPIIVNRLGDDIRVGHHSLPLRFTLPYVAEYMTHYYHTGREAGATWRYEVIPVAERIVRAVCQARGLPEAQELIGIIQTKAEGMFGTKMDELSRTLAAEARTAASAVSQPQTAETFTPEDAVA